MKVTLVVLSLACFIGAIYALPIDGELDNNELKSQIFPNFEEDQTQEESITSRPTKPLQVHHNALKSQGPFSGRLINVVGNKQGYQKTVQRNTIEFNFEAMQKQLEALMEEADNE